MTDIAAPGDTRMAPKSVEKLDKYVDLKIQIGRCWKLRSFVVRIIIGALGSIPKDLSSNLNRLSLHTSIIRTVQLSVLNTTYILRRYLSM